jgi:acetolactate synthase-1/3 small subunit
VEIYILSVLVANHYGVLTRVTNLFGRRGYNIKGLSVGETENPKYSRITIITEGDEQLLAQIQKQLSKLHDVKAAKVLPFNECVSRELIIVKVNKSGGLFAYLDSLPCKVLSEDDKCVIVEVIGETDLIESVIKQMKDFGILEISRTGVTALQKGVQNTINI